MFTCLSYIFEKILFDYEQNPVPLLNSFFS